MTYVLSTAWVEPGKTELLRSWCEELKRRKEEVLPAMRNEGVRREAAFLLPTPHGDLYCVWLEVDDPEAAFAAFRSSPFPIDHEHARVMDEVDGGRGRTSAELLYSFDAGSPTEPTPG